jgi:hypothetical protein
MHTIDVDPPPPPWASYGVRDIETVVPFLARRFTSKRSGSPFRSSRIPSMGSNRWHQCVGCCQYDSLS